MKDKDLHDDRRPTEQGDIGVPDVRDAARNLVALARHLKTSDDRAEQDTHAQAENSNDQRVLKAL